MRENFAKRICELRFLIFTVGKERLQKVNHPERGRHDENDENPAIAILNVGRLNDGVEQEA